VKLKEQAESKKEWSYGVMNLCLVLSSQPSRKRKTKVDSFFIKKEVTYPT